MSRSALDLETVFAVAALEKYTAAANEWCEQQGAKFLYELVEEDVFDDFAVSLGLKVLEKRRLKKALQGPAAEPPDSTDSHSPNARRTAAEIAMNAAIDTVFVKNTFLDLNDCERPTALRRSNTEPAPGTAHDDSEDDDDSNDAHEEAVPATPEISGLYKTITCDGYEPIDEWAWVSDAAANAMPPLAYQQPDYDIVSGNYNGSGCEAFAGDGYSGADTDMMVAPVDMTQQVVGVVMVPVEAMPGFTAVPVMSGPCFPGCVAMPMDRFARWPGDGVGPEPVRDAPPLTQKNVLQRSFSVTSCIHRVRWTVDSRKLKTMDTEAVSPPFELSEGNVQFKMMVRPRITSEMRGGASFKKARGKGTVELKCVDVVDSAMNPSLTFRISIGSVSDPRKQREPRGPIQHNFAESVICGLPSEYALWDFSKVVDKVTKTFVVVLEVLSGSASE
jgi:hypothetical protein